MLFFMFPRSVGITAKFHTLFNIIHNGYFVQKHVLIFNLNCGDDDRIHFFIFWDKIIIYLLFLAIVS